MILSIAKEYIVILIICYLLIYSILRDYYIEFQGVSKVNLLTYDFIGLVNLLQYSPTILLPLL